MLYHLLVMLKARGVTLAEVMAELESGGPAQSGLAEKAARGKPRDSEPWTSRRRQAVSPHRVFSRERVGEAARRYAADPRPTTISTRLQSLNDPISLAEVVEIYLPLSRLLSLYVAATQGLYDATRTFLGTRDGVTPFIIGIAGSVAVGKSTTARILQGAPRPLAEHAEGRPDRHRRLPPAERGADARRA